jgi:Flp pilus assembly protein TadG
VLRRLVTGEEGSAALEFVTAGLLLLVPLVYLILTLAAVQGAALAVEGAARQAARVFVQASSPEEAADRAARAIDFGLADYGIDEDAASVTVSCTGPSRCPSRNAVVAVTVRVTVPLPLLPDVLDLSRSASVPVQATARQQVSRFWTEE